MTGTNENKQKEVSEVFSVINAVIIVIKIMVNVCNPKNYTKVDVLLRLLFVVLNK